MAKKDVKAKPVDKSLAELVAQYQRAREAGKRAYARSDRLMQQIVAAVKPGEQFALNEVGRKAIVHDRFAECSVKGVIWTPTAARRWELEIIEP